jgi:hypothetical protein
LGFVGQGAPDFQYTLCQRIVRDRCIRPYSADDRRFAHYTPVVFHQVGQEFKSLRPEGDLLEATTQESCLQVQCEFAEAILPVALFPRL